MTEIIYCQIPAFMLLLAVELLAFKYAHDEELVGYGLTQNIGTFRPTRVALHEFAAIWQGVRGATSWWPLRGPGWSPDGSSGGTRG